MAESPHYKDLLQLFNDCRVEYLVVGRYAVIKYSEPRYKGSGHLGESFAAEFTPDLSGAGAIRRPFGVRRVTPETFDQTDVIYQMGIAQRF